MRERRKGPTWTCRDRLWVLCGSVCGRRRWGTPLQKRCDDEQNVLLRWKFGVCCVKRAAHPAWVFVTTSGSRKQSARRGERRKGRRVILGSKAPG